MSLITITGTGSSVDQVIANLRERLDEEIGVDAWHLPNSGEDQDVGFVMFGDPCVIEIALSPGGTMASVTVTLTVEGDRLSTAALPRARA